MNKTESLAFKWLQKEGFTGIIYQKNRSPDFITDQGLFEIKRAYETKKSLIKILFYSGQKEQLIQSDASVLVFSENQPTPIDTVTPEEINRLRVRNIILYEVKSGSVRVQGYIRPDLHKWVNKKIDDGIFASESHAVERALLQLRSAMRGKVLTK